MSRLRKILIAFLMLVALPLQGYAAASMLFCKTHAPSTAPAANSSHLHQHDVEPATHEPHAHHQDNVKCGLCGACCQTMPADLMAGLSMAGVAPAELVLFKPPYSYRITPARLERPPGIA